MAIFDADFIPSKDFPMQSMLHFLGLSFNGVMSLIRNGFIARFLSIIHQPFGQLTLISIFIFLGLSYSEIGSHVFMIYYVACAGCMLLLWRNAPEKFTAEYWFISLVAVVVIRILFSNYPVSNDVFRYIWEGKIQHAGFDPYVFHPNSESLAHLRNELWTGINHKGWTAIYGPAAQLFFSLVAYFSPSVLAFKASFMLCDLAILIVLALIVQRKQLHPRSLFLYALNPVIIMAIAGEGHMESLVMFFVVTAYYFGVIKKWGISAILIGLAIASKFTAIIFLPFLIRKDNWQWFVLSIISVLLPLLFFDASLQQIFASLFRFGSQMHFNDSLYGILYLIFGKETALCISGFLFALICGLIWLTQDSLLRAAFLACFAFLLFAPTVHYWYLCMLIPFLTLVPSLPAIVWSVTSVFYFNVLWREAHGMGFSASTQDQLLQYIPVFLSMIFVFVLKIKGKRIKSVSVPLPSVSILIPTINEAKNARVLMQQLHNQTITPKQIIVIDGGSSDRTIKIFEQMGAQVLKVARKGRGNQLVTGFEQATSDAIIILHADVVPDKRVVERVAVALASDPHLVGGALGFQFASKHYKYRVIEFLNRFRVALTDITFGDQGQFFRRLVVAENNCLNAIPLMEDVELALGLQTLGKIRLLDGGLTVSTRRWKSKKFWRNSMDIIYLFAFYLMLRRFCSEPRVDQMYNQYYPESEQAN